MSDGWARMISARQEIVRSLSAVIYQEVEDQVYKNPHFIKKMNDDQITAALRDKAKQFNYAVCLDVSCYDSA